MTQAPFWYDPDPLEPDWPAPSRPWRRLLPLLAGAAVLTLVVGLTAAFGGFGDWVGTRIPLLKPGTELESGQLRTSFVRASASRDYSGGWSVTVIGTCQNISDDVTHVSSPRSFALHVPVLDVYADARLMQFDDTTHLNPGLKPVPCTIDFNVPDPRPLPDYVQIGVFDVAWTDPSLTQSGDKRWTLTGEGFRYFVPLTIQPRD